MKALVLLPLLAGCLIGVEPPEIMSGVGDCIDAECSGGYTCDYDGECASDCILDDDCQSLYFCTDSDRCQRKGGQR